MSKGTDVEVNEGNWKSMKSPKITVFVLSRNIWQSEFAVYMDGRTNLETSILSKDNNHEKKISSQF